MTVSIKELDAHEPPSDELKACWKAFSRADIKDLLKNGNLDDLQDPKHAAEFCLAGTVSAETLNKAIRHLSLDNHDPELHITQDAPIYYHPILPGLLIFPSLIPPAVQKLILRRLVHRDLSQPAHQTNLHLHFNLPYPSPDQNDGDISFFSYTPFSPVTFTPKDPSVHRPLTIKQVLDRKLHWVTLGGQYDWTNRVYPEGEEPPAFPADLAGFLETVFPETLAQAAIVNFYTPGDTMMMHRDVSEETDKGLVSLSFGCEGLFMIAPKDPWKEGEEGVGGRNDGEKKWLLLRLRSGDAIYMTKESRFAWHGVPKVIKGTCPDYLKDWPAEDGKYEDWKGWMSNKRINLNVRQMKD
ncbi:uncharacterized protein CTHT_0041830 [Thermochaetoides thermophila DSM 1495]|uniref:mRNA N(6)-methyladenine demethylase n=1 Tax=Chaetomium thermophilum (strain DSM 1495 / CBS 144.50 / IMI 039719) TaxID=759272 RepID=G0SAC9_CHATD|nr:hypothetical protein CTHT_0041830 [Thermochaetoides thermophila DSM 1495]EGS19701.1 hypothetical protein CTHT_0041830 [Thermochaetoides thermophila DSM 1495]